MKKQNKPRITSVTRVVLIILIINARIARSLSLKFWRISKYDEAPLDFAEIEDSKDSGSERCKVPKVTKYDF